MLNKFNTYFHTIRFLKPIQVFYRVYYFILNRFGNKPTFGKILNKDVVFLSFASTHSSQSYLGESSFQFLNITHTFSQRIDWEIETYGKLWQYNLCYFDFLNSGISKKEGLRIINEFIESKNSLKSAIEPYPTSLRIINWIRFISKYEIKNRAIADCLYEQVELLTKRIEYHILGNHILENAFAIYMAGVFFNESKYIRTGKKLLKNQLKKQILSDGGHFEQSAMYHQLMLFRILECIDIQDKEDAFTKLLKKYAKEMLSWLNAVSFANGDIPLVNDAAKGIAPTTSQLNEFANELGIENVKTNLGDSGYRMFSKNNYECLTDVGGVTATYQPGHTHADALSFILYINNKPFLVDGGTSTYTVCERRQLERSTSSHNTVVVGNNNQTAVWGGFRVSKRAHVKIINEKENENIIASHTGYKSKHVRSFSFGDAIEIIDTYEHRNTKCEAHFHFHPKVSFQLSENSVEFNEGAIVFENALAVKQEVFLYAEQFNRVIKSTKLKVVFTDYLRTIITTIK